MIEMLMVITIIGIVAAMAMPRLDYTRYRVDAGARLVSGALQQAARTAVQKQHDVIVSFDVATQQIRIIEDRDNQPATLTGERVTTRTLEEGVRFIDDPSPRVSSEYGGSLISKLSTTSGLPSVTFHRDGAASSAAEVYVTSARGNAADRRAVTITKATGRADMHRYSGTEWRKPGT
jgi:Tfp pilus assembly protein FimT